MSYGHDVSDVMVAEIANGKSPGLTVDEQGAGLAQSEAEKMIQRAKLSCWNHRKDSGMMSSINTKNS